MNGIEAALMWKRKPKPAKLMLLLIELPIAEINGIPGPGAMVLDLGAISLS